MIVGFDGKRAVANFTGLGNYSRFVIGALSNKFQNELYKVFAPKRKNNKAPAGIRQYKIEIMYDNMKFSP